MTEGIRKTLSFNYIQSATMDRLPIGLKLVIPLTNVKTDSVTFWIWNVPQRFVCRRLCLKHNNVQEGAFNKWGIGSF